MRIGLLAMFALITLMQGICAAETQGADAPLLPRDYCLQTTLAAGGKAQAVIVSSSRQPAYNAIARRVQARIRELTGVTLPIRDGEKDTAAAILAGNNAIVLGNMVTNRFVETLYWDWYTLLDLWYPGAGGYVVRSLHNPYGTGHNVITLGGSDDQGVSAAADAFCRLLPAGQSLTVGWLAEVKLGAAHRMPAKGEWVDPRLRPFQIDNGDPLGYTRCSRAGLIYYYNNDESYARMFRDLALNTNLIAGSDHYHSHTHALIWDLIEESPVFTDADRRAITAKLLQHARGADGTAGRAGIFNYPEDKYMLDRHNSMRANCFLTESRYFNKYWPAEEWQQNLAAVKRYFNRQMTNGKGGSDLGGRGIYSYLECVLIPMQLLHDRRFIDSGALRQYADLNVMHCDNLGYMPDTGQNSPTSYPVYTLMKSAAFLNDGSYLEPLAARERGERIGGFAVTTEEYTSGQAWATGLHAKLPEKMLGLYSLPLTRWEWEILGRSIPIEKSLDKLTLRSGFGRDDQYLLFDGLHGQPFEKPHPDVNAILHFTQYGRPILVDDGGSSTTEHGVVSLSREGFGQEGGRVASLEAHANLPRFGYFQSRAAAHSFSQWDRHLFWRKGKWFVTIDRLKMKDAGNYSLECNWRPVGSPQIHGSEFIATQGSGEANDPRLAIHIVNAEQLPLRCNEISSTNLSRFGGKPDRTPISRVRQVISRQMPAGQENVFTNLCYVSRETTPCRYGIVKLGAHLAALTGDELAYLGLGDGESFTRGDLQVQGEAFCLSPDSLNIVGATLLRWGDLTVRCSAPCNLEYDPADGALTVEAAQPLTLNAGGTTIRFTAGTRSLKLTRVPKASVAALRAAIEQDARAAAKSATPASSAALPALPAKWRFHAPEGVRDTACYVADVDGDGREETLLGLTDGRIVCLDPQGKTRWEYKTGGPVRAITHGRVGGKAAVLFGSDDEQVYALTVDGATLLWKHQCYFSKERYAAYPWWTYEGKAWVLAILPVDLNGDGSEEFVCGTGAGFVETLNNTGERLWQVEFFWGMPDELAIAPLPDGGKSILVNATSACGSQTWRLSADGKRLSANAFDTGRSSWDGTVVNAALVTPLAAGGHPMAVIGRAGAYNELALFDAVTGERKWLHVLGDRINGVAVADLDGDGAAEILAGSPSCWVNAFGQDGAMRWAVELPHEVLALTAHGGSIFAQCADGKVYRLSPAGKINGVFDQQVELGPRPWIHWQFSTGTAGVCIGNKVGLVTMLPD